MGGVLVRLIQETPGVTLTGAVDRRGSSRVGQDAGEVVGIGHLGVEIVDHIKVSSGAKSVIMDFTTPEASVAHMKEAAKSSTPIVIGTTGLSSSQVRQIRKLATKTAAVFAPNMSLGVNLLLDLVGEMARSLGDSYDVEIVEAHHRFKKDAPSGTALALARAAREALGYKPDRLGAIGRSGVSERKKTDIGVVSMRAGDIVGEHTVMFGGIGERIELVHRTHSRDAFGHGAMRAAQWVVGKENGLYGMQDVLRQSG